MKTRHHALPACLSRLNAGVITVFITAILLLGATLAQAQLQTRVETKSDGSGVVVPDQNVAAGTSVTVFAIVRDGGGAYLSNTVAAWSLTGTSGGVVSGDLAPTIGLSATFTGHKLGSAVIQAVGNSGTGVSGVQTVVAGAASATTVETAADGSGVVVPAQNLAAGTAVGVFAIARDSAGNFTGNPTATWSVLVVAGGVTAGDLTPASGTSSTFTGHLAGSGVIQAVANGFTGQSGALTVNAGPVSQLVWSTQPGLATNGYPFAQQPVLMTADAFGNPTTNGLPATLNVTVTPGSGSVPLAGTTNVNIGTAGGDGVATFTNLEIDSPQRSVQLTAAAPAYGAPVAGAAVWLDANDSTTVFSDASGSVTNWLDKSGGGNNFDQPLGTGFIGYTNASTASSRKTVTFGGTGALLNNTYRLAGTNLSFFLVSKKKTTGGAGNMGPFAGTDGVNNDYNNPDNFNVSYQGGNNIPQVQHNSHDAVYGNYEPSTAYHDLEFVAADSSTIYINGHAGGNGGAGGGAWNISDLSIGSRLNGLNGQNFYIGDVAELLVYNSTLGAADRVTVETYLSNKWFTAAFPLNSTLAVSAAFQVYQPATLLQVESRADGSGTVVPVESLAAGSSVKVYAILRNGSTTAFLGNVAATWSLTAVTGGVAAGDLAVAGDSKSATFNAHKPGSAIIQAAANGEHGVSGVQTVQVGAVSQTDLESAADGSGTPLLAQNVAAGSSVTAYAIARDAAGNFAGNVAAVWSLQDVTGGVIGGDLTVAGDNRSATFNAHRTGTAIVQAVANGFTGQSGLLMVGAGPFAQLVWTTQPGIATNGAPFGRQPVLETADAFGSATTNGLPATLDVTVSLNPGARQLGGTTNVNLGTSGGNGIVSFTDLQIALAGPGNTLTAAVSDLGAVPAGIPNCVLWLDASDPNAVSLNGDGVTVNAWNDKSGTGNNASAGVAPLWATNANLTGSAGLGRVLRFDGASTYFNVNLGYLSGSPYTIIALEVATNKTQSGGNLNDYFIGNTEAAGTPKDEGLHMGYFSTTDFRLGQWADDLDFTVTNSTNTPRVWSGKVDVSLNQVLYLNGAQVAARTVANFLSGEQFTGHIGSAFDPPNPGENASQSYYAGDLASVVVYNRDLSDMERNQVENFLSATWLTVFTNAVSAPFAVAGAVTPGQPVLGILTAGGTVTISWPVNGNSGFNLYSKTSLATAGGWTLVTPAPSMVGANYQVVLAATGGTRFFRLSNP